MIHFFNPVFSRAHSGVKVQTRKCLFYNVYISRISFPRTVFVRIKFVLLLTHDYDSLVRILLFILDAYIVGCLYISIVKIVIVYLTVNNIIMS